MKNVYTNVLWIKQISFIANNECKEYFGTAEGDFKLHYINHTMSLKYKKRVHDTELSKYFGKLKEENLDYNLHWSIKTSKRMHPLIRNKDYC